MESPQKENNTVIKGDAVAVVWFLDNVNLQLLRPDQKPLFDATGVHALNKSNLF